MGRSAAISDILVTVTPGVRRPSANSAEFSRSAMSKAFVAGATGYTGREVVRALVVRGVAASAHVRPNSPQLDALTREFAAEGATLDTTSWDGAALTATLTRLRPSVVFALLGTTRARVHAARQAGAPAESYD